MRSSIIACIQTPASSIPYKALWEAHKSFSSKFNVSMACVYSENSHTSIWHLHSLSLGSEYRLFQYVSVATGENSITVCMTIDVVIGNHIFASCEIGMPVKSDKNIIMGRGCSYYQVCLYRQHFTALYRQML